MMIPVNLKNLVTAYYNDFVSEFNIQDFPKLHNVFAIISMESSWQPEAQSPYARGLMQISQPALETINRLYNKKFTYHDMLRADHNVFVGIRYLRWLYKALSHLEPTLREIATVMAYNWGIGNVQNWLSLAKDNPQIKKEVPQETKDYVISYIYWCEYWKKNLKAKTLQH